MKNLVKLLMIATIVAFASTSFSQTFGVKAGMNLSNMLMKDNTETLSDDYKMLIGFKVGGTVEFSFSDACSFETGLLLSTKGYRVSSTDAGITVKGSTTLYYLDIPLTVKGYYDLNNSAKIYGVFGPYIGVGLSGKSKSTETGPGLNTTDTYTIKWGSDKTKDDLKMLDYGLSIGAGVEFNEDMQVGISYALGLANISPSTDNGAKIKNRVLDLTFGYKFGK